MHLHDKEADRLAVKAAFLDQQLIRERTVAIDFTGNKPEIRRSTEQDTARAMDIEGELGTIREAGQAFLDARFSASQVKNMEKTLGHSSRRVENQQKTVDEALADKIEATKSRSTKPKTSCNPWSSNWKTA